VRAEAGPRFERFTREVSLALELLAVLFAALFLADARCGATANSKHVIVVVDGSLSMLARAGGKPLSDSVRDAVAQVARSENAGTLTVIESGPRPSVFIGPQQPLDRALSALEQWTPAQPAHDLNPAFALARSLASVDQRIFFFTDGPVGDSVVLPPQVEGRSLGAAAENLALLSAQRRDEGGLAQVTVRVGNFTAKAQQLSVQFAPADAPAQTQQVSLEPSATAVLRAGFKSAGAITVSLPDDALPEDGRVTLLPAPLADVSVGFLSGLDPSAQAALTRFLNIAPSVVVREPATLTFGPPGSQAKVTVGATGAARSFVGPFFALKGHPLFDDVQLGGAVWTAGENPPGRMLLSMGDAVLVSEEDDGSLHLNVDVAKSNVQRTVAWPVLLGNVLRVARLSTPGLPRRHLMLGEEVPVVTSPGASWVLRGPGKLQRPVMGVGALTAPPLPAPGRWALLKDGEEVDALVVLPLDPRESDLRTRGPWQVDAQRGSALAGLATSTPRAFWPVVLVLALLLLDFWVTARTVRRGRT
jgi:hypothetical protein